MTGALYLIRPGMQVIVSESGPLNITRGSTHTISTGKISGRIFFSDVLYPKGAIFFLALLLQFVAIHSPNITIPGQLALPGVTCNVIAITINLILVYFASEAMEQQGKSTRVIAWLNKAMGAALVALGLRLVQEKL